MVIKSYKGWKFVITILNSKSEEFRLIEDYYKNTSTEDSKCFEQLEKFQVYKVMERNSKKVEEKSNNLMLFHGTDENGANGILRNGFRNSRKGFFGQGVYMTESSDVATAYPISQMLKKIFIKCEGYIFVNEVLESQKMKTVTYEKYVFSRTQLNAHLTKYVKEQNCEMPDEDLSSKTREDVYVKDRLGRRYRNVASDKEEDDEFVADCKFVAPRYLIYYEWKKWESMKNVLYLSALVVCCSVGLYCSTKYSRRFIKYLYKKK